MGKKNTIIVNNDYLQDIVDEYDQCIQLTQDLQRYNTVAKSKFDISFQGGAKDMSLDCFDKIAEHLTLIESCIESMKTYVDSAKTTLQETDNAISHGSVAKGKF